MILTSCSDSEIKSRHEILQHDQLFHVCVPSSPQHGTHPSLLAQSKSAVPDACDIEAAVVVHTWGNHLHMPTNSNISVEIYHFKVLSYISSNLIITRYILLSLFIK